MGELAGLDDFRTESAYVRSNMAEIYKYWIGQAGFDGFRIDTTRHVEIGFWQNWCPPIHTYAASLGKSNFFMFGEVFDGSDSLCGSYTGTQSGGAFAQDSVLDYPLFFRISSVFATASGNTKQIEDRYNGIAANYDPSAQMRLVTFLDNHDKPASSTPAAPPPRGSMWRWPSSIPPAASRASIMAPNRPSTAARIPTTARTCLTASSSKGRRSETIST